jgi:lipopolysaccharide export system protein LptC
MSEAATREREIKQHWAEPGSRHDRVVRLAKLGLPAAVILVIAVLAIAPFDRQGDVSFILDKNKVDEAEERMRVEAASAIQRSSEVPIVDISGMLARLQLAQGPVMIGANLARYNLDTQRIAILGPVRVIGPDAYRLETYDVMVDLKRRRLTSSGPVAGSMQLGNFRAGSLTADLGDRKVVLGGGARLKIVQGAVR